MRNIVLLNDVPFEGVINMPLFEINYLPTTVDITKYDALIITSKNAIKAIDSFNFDWKNIPCYCIAPKTAATVKEFGGKVDFIGKKSHGDDFAQELYALLKNKNVVYIKAAKTVSNLVTLLQKKSIKVDELVAYETLCTKKNFEKPKKNSVIVFTSPSSVECFFKHFTWNTSYKAVVIGKTTAKYMPIEVDYCISKIQSLESCIKLASSL